MNMFNKSSIDILTIIPARAGSKRILGKNIKCLSGMPLIAWSIKAALDSSLENIIVSTESNEIAQISLAYGAEVPYMRSSEFAADQSSVIDVVLEALDFYEELGKVFDAVLLLQPTSPFRTAKTIQTAIKKFDGNESVVSVSPARSHPYWCKQVKNGKLIAFDDSNDGALLRSQDLPEIYDLNGSIYLSSVKNIKINKSFYSENTSALIIHSEEESLDIDTPFDWFVAEAIARNI